MSSIITPTWTDTPVSVVAAQGLSFGSSLRGTLDLRTKHGAYCFPKIGRKGTTALSGGTTPGVDVLFRRILNNDTATAGGAEAAQIALLSSTAAAISTTCATSDSNLGQNALNVASVTSFAAGDLICIQDSGGGVTRLEFHRVSKTATGILTLDRPLQFTHTSAGADTVRNKADIFAPVWLDGGSLWEVVFDYGDDTAGSDVVCVCLAQTLDSYTVT